MQDVRGEAKDELNAAFVQTIDDSQKDLDIKSGSSEPVNLEALQPGAKIIVRGFSKPVILRRVEGSTAEIEAGPLRMKVALDEITGIEGAVSGKVPISPTARENITVTSSGTSGEGTTGSEINVIGMTVEQASERVDKFLDEAALAQRPTVRIIHGHGTGALRKGLNAFLKSHPLVQRAQFESEDHGGKAITVVELRN